MWHDDRRYHVRELGTFERDLGYLEERMLTEVTALAGDDYDSTEAARSRLAEARAAVLGARTLVRQTLRELPGAKQRPPLRSV